MSDKNVGEFTSAAHAGDIEKLKEFIENGIGVNSKESQQLGFTALMQAAGRGHIEIVKYLVAHGADVNIQSEHGWTALLIASEGGQIEIIHYLVEKGADINHQERVYDNTALMLASEIGDIEIVKYLIEHGADTSKLTIVDWLNCGSLQHVKAGIENGVDPNQRVQRPYDDDRGNITPANTLLINASIYGHVEIVKYLLACGADVHLKGFSFSGVRTALDWAIENNHIEIIKYLKEAGATE